MSLRLPCRQTAVTSFTWILALVNWIAIAILLIGGFDEGIENLKARGILRLIAFVLPNVFLLLGLITSCRCLFRPTVLFYQFLTYTFWFVFGVNLWVALLPNVFISPQMRLERQEDVDVEYDESPDVVESLYYAFGFLGISLFTRFVVAVLESYQKYLKTKKESVDLEKTYISGAIDF